MALYRVRHCSVYVNSKKIATSTGGSLEMSGNDEDQVTDEGWSGASDGAITSKLNLDTIVPVTGELKALRTAFLNKQYVKDYQQAFNEAAKWCAENAPTENPHIFLKNVNIRLQIWCVARAVCDPNDIRQAYFERGDEQVEESLRPEGVKYLFDAFETLHLEESVVAPWANDDEVLDLVSILAANTQLPALPDAKQARCRRLIRHLLDTLTQ